MPRERAHDLADDEFHRAFGDVSQTPPPRFALGTRELLRLPETEDGEDTLDEHMETDGEQDVLASPNAVFISDETDRIHDLNELAAQLVGYDRTELLGAPVTSVFASTNGLARPLRATGQRVRYVSASSGLRARHRSGRELPVDVFVGPHPRNASVIIVRPLAPDQDGMREEDVAQIVHDLKSPLATIALEADLLDYRLDAGDHYDARNVVARITQNVAYLDRMVQDLLDLCSLDAGQLVLHRAPTELGALLEGVVGRMVLSCDRGRVFLEVRSRITLELDDLRIERVVANLLQNALKYSPSTTGIVVRLDQYPDVCCVSVIDAGPGLTPAEMTSVFEKFKRGGSPAALHHGTGLGLYVSKRIIEAHGGRIGVDSVHGVGSRFFFELPLR